MTVEEIGKVNVLKMIEWVKGIPLKDWPQQSTTELKPSMQTNLDWRGFGAVAWRVAHELGFDNAYQLMLSVVMPGHSIEPHKDQQPDYWAYRAHVPLLTNPKAFMVMDDGKHHMKVGHAYKVNVRETHSVVNDGKTPRIHFMFDVRL